MVIDKNLTLEKRDRLPEALRVLLADYPRDGWEAHPRFTGLVQFWLERHMMFRKILDLLQTETQSRLDASMDIQDYVPRLSRFGGMLLNQLHGHHQIEDFHYFPTLKAIDPRLERGFDILDSDHHALAGYLQRFAEGANAILGHVADEVKLRDATGAFEGELKLFERMLDRHLNDEEDLIVPVILKNGVAGLE